MEVSTTCFLQRVKVRMIHHSDGEIESVIPKCHRELLIPTCIPREQCASHALVYFFRTWRCYIASSEARFCIVSLNLFSPPIEAQSCRCTNRAGRLPLLSSFPGRTGFGNAAALSFNILSSLLLTSSSIPLLFRFSLPQRTVEQAGAHKVRPASLFSL